MKKIIALMMMVMFTLALTAGDESINYVTSGGKTYFCQKVKFGLFCAKVMNNEGKVVKIPFSEVDSYCCKGKLFERLPLVIDGVETDRTALMEYITSRNGLRLYRYCEYGECGEIANSTYKPAHLQFEYYVFQDGKFYLQVDQKNARTVLPFFGVEVL